MKKGTGVVVKTAGLLLNKIPVFYSTNFETTLLGRKPLKRFGRIWYSDGQDHERVGSRPDVINDGKARDYWSSKNDDLILIFEEQDSGLSLLTSITNNAGLCELIRVANDKLADSTHRARLMLTTHAPHETVTSNSAKYPVRVQKRAHQARSVQEALSGMNTAQIVHTINNGSIIGDITSGDFVIAESIYGPSRAVKMGKAKQQKHPVHSQQPWHPPLALKKQKLCMDIFFVGDLAFLISVSDPMDCTDVIWLRNYKVKEIVIAAVEVIKIYTTHGYIISEIFWDDQSGMGALSIPEYKVTPRTGGDFVPIAERKIQTIKGNHRADIFALPYTIFGLLHVWGVRWAAESCNLLVSKKTPNMPSPYVQRYNFKPTLQQVAQYSFGQFGIVTEPVPDMQKNLVSVPRARNVILMQRPPYPGASALFIDTDLLLEEPSQIITVKRILSDFKPMPVTDKFIKDMEALAKEKKQFFEPTFVYRNAPLPDPPLEEQDHLAGVQEDPILQPEGPANQLAQTTEAMDREAQTSQQATSARPKARQGDVQGEQAQHTQQQDEDPDTESVGPAAAPVAAVFLEADPPGPNANIHKPAERRAQTSPLAGVDKSTASKRKRKQELTESQKDSVKKAKSDTQLQAPSSSDAADQLPHVGVNLQSGNPIFGYPKGKRRREATLPSADEAFITAETTDQSSRSGRRMRSTRTDSYVWLTSPPVSVNAKFINQLNDNDDTESQSTLQSIVKEFCNQDDKETYAPVLLSSLSNRQLKKVLSSQMFTVCKYGPDGAFIKVKSRLVAGGHRQRHEMYDRSEIASPTAGPTSVFALAHIAAVENRHVMTCDITAAYLNALMPLDPDGDPIVMFLDKTLAQLLLIVRPDYQRFVEENTGKIYVRLNKALYGCIQSAKLWYDKLVSDLAEIGFEPNPYDPCILNATINDVQCSIALHVDDLLVTSVDQRALKVVEEFLQSKYSEISAHHGTVHEYLGMNFDFSHPGAVSISQYGMVSNLVASMAQTSRSTPAGASLFETDPQSECLPESAKQDFHSKVAALLYLSKKTRPDILLPVSFLTTRVSNPTVQDMSKLLRVLMYLNGTRDKCLILQAQDDSPLRVYSFIDSSYATHSDMVSHTGVYVTLGRGAVYAKSSRQKLVTKSSTEAELVALATGLEETLWLRHFLEMQGYQMPPSIVYQDNRSTVTLAEDGFKRASRTKHMDIRYFWCKDLIQRHEIVIDDCHTDLHTADMLTKPLQGDKFAFFRSRLLGSASNHVEPRRPQSEK